MVADRCIAEIATANDARASATVAVAVVAVEWAAADQLASYKMCPRWAFNALVAVSRLLNSPLPQTPVAQFIAETATNETNFVLYEEKQS